MKLWMMAAILVISSASVLTSCSSDNDDNPVSQPRERNIAFEGIVNGRDMGGLVMQDGRTIRFDMLVRSGNLSKATDADVAILTGQYRLSNVFDFRFDAEVATSPDRVIDGVSNTQLSTMPTAVIESYASGGSSSGQTAPSDQTALLLQRAFDPQMQAVARGLYPAIVTDADAQVRYGEFLRGVLAAKGGVLWHCSQGKDRAGWGSAFVLAALGASRQVIVEDFDLSTLSYADQVEALSAQVRDKEGGDEAVAFIRAIIGVSRENFEATLDMIDQQYGSLSAYIENQLGFSREEQLQLRAKYLH